MPAVTTILKSAGNPDGVALPVLLYALIADIEALGGDLRERGHEAERIVLGNNAQVIGALRLAIQHFGHSRAVLDGARPAEPIDAIRTPEGDAREAETIAARPPPPGTAEAPGVPTV